MPEITEALREKIVTAIEECTKARMEIYDVAVSLRAMADRCDKIEAVLDDVEASICISHGVEIAGHCDHCSRLIFIGDRGHWGGRGEVYCESYRMTYGAAASRGRDVDDMIRLHLANGGSLDDHVSPEILR